MAFFKLEKNPTPLATVPSGHRHWPCWHVEPPMQRSRPVGHGPSGGTVCKKKNLKFRIFREQTTDLWADIGKFR